MKAKKVTAILMAGIMAMSMTAFSVNAEEETATETEESSETSSSGDTVKMGLVTAVSGQNMLVGEEAMAAADLAVEEINAAGGVNGQDIELVVTDEVDNLEMSVLATQELLSNDEVSVVIGSMYSNYSQAALPAVLEAEVPYMSLGSSSGISNEHNPWAWQDRPLDTAQGQALADYVVNTLGCSNPAIMYSTQNTFISLEEQVVAGFENNGITVAEENLFAFPDDESNYSPYIAQIMDGDYDCVIAIANQSPAATICQQAEQAGLSSKGIPLVGSTSFCSNVCITTAGDAANGWYSIANWIPGGANEVAAAFEENYIAANPQWEISDLAGVCVYDAVYIFAEAMKIAGTNTDRAAINEAMEQVEFQGAQSYFKYNEDHSFASSVMISQNIDGVPTVMETVTYR